MLVSQLLKPLLFTAALCWVTPASAQKPAKPQERAPTDCPASRTDEAKARSERPVLLIPRPDFLGVTPSSGSVRSIVLP